MNIFTIYSLFYSLLLNVVYFSKKRIRNVENKIFELIMLTNFIGILLAISGYYTILKMEYIPIINTVISKGYIVYLLTWLTLFTFYIFTISSKDSKKEERKIKLLFSLLYFVFLIFILVLPLYYHNLNGAVYSYGPSANVMYTVSSVYIFIWVIRLLRNIKDIKDKKYLPIFAFMALGLAVMLIQKTHPELLLMTSMETFIVFLMFHTIENPDVNMLREVHKSKEISDAANEEKTLFLYNMTQEIRNTTSEIDDNADIILDSDSIDTDKDCAREIKGITSKFRTMTNEMFDVSKLDSASIKVYNSKYNIKNILKEIVTMYSKICKDKNIDFRVNIDRDVPEVLYGDSINVKEVLSIIIDNSVKYTKEGFIEFNVSTIIKNNVCRLIMTIEDSGVGIKSDDINKIKIGDKSLSKANKLVTLMNGALMVSSNYGMGTKVKVILDQKIEINVNKDIAKYSEIYDNIKILMVDDSEAGIKIIEKLIKGSNIKMDFAMNGRECIDKIKMYGKYDAILLDEQLTQINASELLTKIKTIRNFNIPVILLTKDNSYEYNDEYKKLGFSDYILKPVKKDELLRKTEMYVRKDK